MLLTLTPKTRLDNKVSSEAFQKDKIMSRRPWTPDEYLQLLNELIDSIRWSHRHHNFITSQNESTFSSSQKSLFIAWASWVTQGVTLKYFLSFAPILVTEYSLYLRITFQFHALLHIFGALILTLIFFCPEDFNNLVMGRFASGLSLLVFFLTGAQSI